MEKQVHIVKITNTTVLNELKNENSRVNFSLDTTLGTGKYLLTQNKWRIEFFENSL